MSDTPAPIAIPAKRRTRGDKGKTHKPHKPHKPHAPRSDVGKPRARRPNPNTMPVEELLAIVARRTAAAPACAEPTA